MPLLQSPSDQSIITTLNSQYGIAIVKLTLLPLGADMNASVYKAEAQDLSFYFVKLKTGQQQHMHITILELLHQVGLQQIIPPLKTIQGQSTQAIEDFNLFVYPFIEGQNGFSRPLTDAQWITFGKVLRQIHEIQIPPFIQQQLRRESYSSQWREMVRSLLNLLEAELSGDEIVQTLKAFIKEKKTAIERLVKRTEELARKIQKESHPYVLCHSDIHAGNVLIGENSCFYIVDWDDPIIAPKERDLMFIGGGVGNVWNHPYEEKLFYQGYGKSEVNEQILAYYRHERIVEDLAIYIQTLLSTTVAKGEKEEAYHLIVSMFQPRDVISIAFKTDGGPQQLMLLKAKK